MARPDLTDTPLVLLDEVLFTDGSSYVQEGISIIWSQALARGTSAQKAELITLIQALQWQKATIWLPKVVALVHYKGHQKGDSLEATGNQAADEAAWEAALKPVGPLHILITLPKPDLPTSPTYSEKEQKLATQKQASPNQEG
ncbi:hypothetical protein QTO34_000334 [Cnephaeus nilssonii]|uniref:RNase H type-1 domain-containing protein n=1 Tax=Cnephaeus nilssonii TaxID=3371016 RepID=A0AA40IBD1_CNENI|nr:hypothetical protein QTO34_000334 [Eptesicus nilssonii]